MTMPIEHMQLSANGQRLYAACAGPVEAPLVILLHGFPELSYGWRHQLGALAAAGFRVVAPDQRGYGHSSKPQGTDAYRIDVLASDVVALAHALGRPSAAVVGHDWGGLVAWHLLSEQPAFVRRAAILNAPHPASMVGYTLAHPTQALKSLYVAFFQLPWLPEAVLQANDHALLKWMLTGTSRPGTFGDDELEVYRQSWSMDGALTGMLAWYRALPLAPSRQQHRARPPVRIIWGDRDAALNADLAEQALAHCDRGEVIHLEDATHWLHHEQSARVNDLLVEFLQRS